MPQVFHKNTRQPLSWRRFQTQLGRRKRLRQPAMGSDAQGAEEGSRRPGNAATGMPCLADSCLVANSHSHAEDTIADTSEDAAVPRPKRKALANPEVANCLRHGGLVTTSALRRRLRQLEKQADVPQPAIHHALAIGAWCGRCSQRRSIDSCTLAVAAWYLSEISQPWVISPPF